jgi:hypothetical protein
LDQARIFLGENRNQGGPQALNRPSSAEREGEAMLRNRGMATSGCLVLVIFIALLAYAGFKAGEAYWTYYQVREQVREVLTWAVAGQPKNEATIIQKVISDAGDVGVQVKPRNVRITQTAETLALTVSWVQVLQFPSYSYPLRMEVNLSEIKRWHRGGLVVK